MLAIYFSDTSSSYPGRSTAVSSFVLSPSSSIIPMRRATTHHPSSTTSLAPSYASHRATHSWTAHSNLSLQPPPTNNGDNMPIANLSEPTLKSYPPLSNFPLQPVAIPSTRTNSISPLPVSQGTPSNSVSTFPSRATQTCAPVPLADPPSIKKHQRNSGIFKGLSIRPESGHLRKKSSISSLPTPPFPISPRKRFRYADETISSATTVSDISEWDEWNAGDEDSTARERVEMSFESVRLERSDRKARRGVGVRHSGSRSASGTSGDRTVSEASVIIEVPSTGMSREMGMNDSCEYC